VIIFIKALMRRLFGLPYYKAIVLIVVGKCWAKMHQSVGDASAGILVAKAIGAMKVSSK